MHACLPAENPDPTPQLKKSASPTQPLATPQTLAETHLSPGRIVAETIDGRVPHPNWLQGNKVGASAWDIDCMVGNAASTSLNVHHIEIDVGDCHFQIHV